MVRLQSSSDEWRGVGAPTITDFWLSTPTGAVMATQVWPTVPIAAESVGVVLVPGIAHEHHTMHFGLLATARALAESGVPALLIDLTGTAQGPDRLDAPDVVARWGSEVRAAVDHLRTSGVHHVALLGTRLGALIAAHAAATAPVDLVAMWAPVLSGRRYGRELALMQAAASDHATVPTSGVTIAGYHLPDGLLAQLRTVALDRLPAKPAPVLCLIDTRERLESVDTTAEPFASAHVDRVVAPTTDEWLFDGADGITVPHADLPVVVAAIRRAVRTPASAPAVAVVPTGTGVADVGEPGSGVRAPDVTGSVAREFRYQDATIRETLVRFGRFGLSGILCEPVEPADVGAPPALMVTTVGPGRLFVEMARRDAARGRTSLRFDLAGFGTSDRRGAAWADFYAPGAPEEIESAIEEMVRRGHPRVDIVGFCAGAWSAIQMRPHPAVRRIVGINLQLFIRRRILHRRPWPDLAPGPLLLASLAQRREVRRVVKRIQFVHPVPGPTLRWLRRHRRAGVDVTLIYADEDRGYEYYRDRIDTPVWRPRPRLRPTVRTYVGLGHLPAGPTRDRMLDEIHTAT